MSSLLTLSHSPEDPAYVLRAIPHAYEEAGRQQFKGMPGINWVSDRRAPNGRGYYRGPAEAIELVASTLAAAGVCKVQRDGFPATHTQLLRDCTTAAIPPSGAELRSYQHEGAAWIASMLVNTRGALLADDMGIGKSAQAITALDRVAPEAGIIVVCPAVVALHWKQQVKRWGAADESAERWHIYSYEGFRIAMAGGTKKKPQALPDAAAIVLDEIHYCGNPKSKRAMAVAAWRALHPQAYAVGLSGTPIPAYVWQLWHCLDILWPGRFGRAWNFQERYCDGRWEEIAHTEKTVWNREGVSRSEELAKRLSACMLRRTKADVALELPPRTRTTIEIELPPKALRDLHKAAAAIDWSGGQLQGKGVSALLSHIEEYKIDAAEELAMNVMAAGSRPLILTTRKATAAELGRRLSAPVADGDVDPQERQRLLADAECGVATLYAVTTGIDLVGYDVIIMTGLDWVPSTLLQGEARIHRIGQHRPVTIYYLIGQHTLDEVVRERVIERLDTFGSIIGDDGSDGMGRALGALGDDELLAGLVASMKEAA